MLWADMAQEDELGEEDEKKAAVAASGEEEEEEQEKMEEKKASTSATGLSREQREYIRFKNVGRKKDFTCLERIRGRFVNIVEGLELHTGSLVRWSRRGLLIVCMICRRRGGISSWEQIFGEEMKRMTEASSLAIVEKRTTYCPGECVGIFVQLLDWNRRLAKKKL